MARLGVVGIFLVFFVATWTRRSEALDDHQLSQDLLDLKLMGLRLETKLTMIEGLVNRLNAQANKCAQNGRSGGGGESETEVATSDTQERILRAQQAIIDISNRNTVELENLSQLVVTQTSKLANRSDAMLGLLKSSRQPDIAASTQGRRHPVDRHNV
ncbi:uncharacterized protein LOC8051867 [Ixodes scapularis]|uniref:uncharacterized protein LOC8051867 n=1 Tax=Ixodes scapularis TaxID=6945 RepID=UPI001A9E7033|nr:uncharacterized protein LOC8051867 [Ixodes scapularis]